ncbi:MAG TPA: hypothetical protein VF051_11330, partial [Hyphomicrobiaceae bacterium]
SRCQVFIVAQEFEKLNPRVAASILFDARQFGDKVQLLLEMNPGFAGDIADLIIPRGSNLKNTSQILEQVGIADGKKCREGFEQSVVGE